MAFFILLSFHSHLKFLCTLFLLLVLYYRSRMTSLLGFAVLFVWRKALICTLHTIPWRCTFVLFLLWKQMSLLTKNLLVNACICVISFPFKWQILCRCSCSYVPYCSYVQKRKKKMLGINKCTNSTKSCLTWFYRLPASDD